MRHWRFAARAAAVATIVLLGSARGDAVLAQDYGSLADRVDRLQRDIDVLQRQMARGLSAGGGGAAAGGGVSSGYVSQSEARFSEIEQQLRQLTGKIEEVNFQVGQLRTRLDKLQGDVDFRLTQLERGGGGARPAAAAPAPAQAAARQGDERVAIVPGGPPGQAPAQAAAPAPPAGPLPAGSPKEQYDYAAAQLQRAQRGLADFGPAERAFRAFVAQHPNHGLAPNAQYWLGETFYVRREYQEAATAFGQGAQKYSQTDKGPDLWLKLGMSLGQLKKTREACGAFAELQRRYPKAPQNVNSAVQREKQRYSC